jgi:flagellin
MNAQNQLGKSQSMNDQALQRLSSGLRINSAKDDAAGLAISTRFQAQISGLNVAQRNANDGISLAQTAEGSLGEITNNLQRIRELSVQSANSTNSASDRQALQEEVSQLVSEIERTATTAQFNGLNLLDGSFTSQQFQVGANANQTINVSVGGARSTQIGSIVNETGTNTVSTVVTGEGGSARATADTYDGVTSTASTGTNVTINGTNIVSSSGFTGQTSLGETNDSAFAKAAAINASGAGVTAVASNEQRIALGGTNALTGNDLDTALDTIDYTLSVNGTNVFSTQLANGGTTSVAASDVVDAINSSSDDTGVTATFDTGTNEIVLNNATGGNIELAETSVINNAGGTANTFDGLLSTGENAASVTADFRGDITLQSSETVNVTAGADIIGLDAGSQNVLTVDTSKSVATIDISSVSGANDAILAIDAALDSINSSRAQLGAVQSRFDSTISNLATTSENLSAANSRILDADFAAETAKLAKSQVLQQAGISVLAQANARPQQVLSLLQ